MSSLLLLTCDEDEAVRVEGGAGIASAPSKLRCYSSVRITRQDSNNDNSTHQSAPVIICCAHHQSFLTVAAATSGAAVVQLCNVSSSSSRSRGLQSNCCQLTNTNNTLETFSFCVTCR